MAEREQESQRDQNGPDLEGPLGAREQESAAREGDGENGQQDARSQRASEQGQSQEALAVFSKATRGTGQPLPNRQRWESLLGEDFSSVQVWTGKASELSDLDTNGAASGDKIALGGGPSPALLAHELVHVVQFRKAGMPQAPLSEKGDAAEAEAEAGANQLVAGQPFSPGARPTGQVMRDPGDGDGDGGGADLAAAPSPFAGNSRPAAGEEAMDNPTGVQRGHHTGRGWRFAGGQSGVRVVPIEANDAPDNPVPTSLSDVRDATTIERRRREPVERSGSVSAEADGNLAEGEFGDEDAGGAHGEGQLGHGHAEASASASAGENGIAVAASAGAEFHLAEGKLVVQSPWGEVDWWGETIRGRVGVELTADLVARANGSVNLTARGGADGFQGQLTGQLGAAARAEAGGKVFSKIQWRPRSVGQGGDALEFLHASLGASGWAGVGAQATFTASISPEIAVEASVGAALGLGGSGDFSIKINAIRAGLLAITLAGRGYAGAMDSMGRPRLAQSVHRYLDGLVQAESAHALVQNDLHEDCSTEEKAKLVESLLSALATSVHGDSLAKVVESATDDLANLFTHVPGGQTAVLEGLAEDTEPGTRVRAAIAEAQLTNPEEGELDTELTPAVAISLVDSGAHREMDDTALIRLINVLLEGSAAGHRKIIRILEDLPHKNQTLLGDGGLRQRMLSTMEDYWHAALLGILVVANISGYQLTAPAARAIVFEEMHADARMDTAARTRVLNALREANPESDQHTRRAFATLLHYMHENDGVSLMDQQNGWSANVAVSLVDRFNTGSGAAAGEGEASGGGASEASGGGASSGNLNDAEVNLLLSRLEDDNTLTMVVFMRGLGSRLPGVLTSERAQDILDESDEGPAQDGLIALYIRYQILPDLEMTPGVAAAVIRLGLHRSPEVTADQLWEIVDELTNTQQLGNNIQIALLFNDRPDLLENGEKTRALINTLYEREHRYYPYFVATVRKARVHTLLPPNATPGSDTWPHIRAEDANRLMQVDDMLGMLSMDELKHLIKRGDAGNRILHLLRARRDLVESLAQPGNIAAPNAEEVSDIEDIAAKMNESHTLSFVRVLATAGLAAYVSHFTRTATKRQMVEHLTDNYVMSRTQQGFHYLPVFDYVIENRMTDTAVGILRGVPASVAALGPHLETFFQLPLDEESRADMLRIIRSEMSTFRITEDKLHTSHDVRELLEIHGHLEDAEKLILARKALEYPEVHRNALMYLLRNHWDATYSAMNHAEQGRLREYFGFSGRVTDESSPQLREFAVLLRENDPDAVGDVHGGTDQANVGEAEQGTEGQTAEEMEAAGEEGEAELDDISLMSRLRSHLNLPPAPDTALAMRQLIERHPSLIEQVRSDGSLRSEIIRHWEGETRVTNQVFLIRIGVLDILDTGQVPQTAVLEFIRLNYHRRDILTMEQKAQLFAGRLDSGPKSETDPARVEMMRAHSNRLSALLQRVIPSASSLMFLDSFESTEAVAGAIAVLYVNADQMDGVYGTIGAFFDPEAHRSDDKGRVVAQRLVEHHAESLDSIVLTGVFDTLIFHSGEGNQRSRNLLINLVQRLPTEELRSMFPNTAPGRFSRLMAQVLLHSQGRETIGTLYNRVPSLRDRIINLRGEENVARMLARRRFYRSMTTPQRGRLVERLSELGDEGQEYGVEVFRYAVDQDEWEPLLNRFGGLDALLTRFSGTHRRSIRELIRGAQRREGLNDGIEAQPTDLSPSQLLQDDTGTQMA